MELWGMQGMVLLAFIVGALFLINYMTKKPFMKFVPVSKQLLALIGVGLIVYAGTQTAWWGLSTQAAAPYTPGVTEPVAGISYTAKGSESDANLTYDAASRTFTCNFYENKADDTIWNNGDTAAVAAGQISTLTFTITLYRADYSTDNAITSITSTIPTFKGSGENAAISYSPINYDTSVDEYELAMTPSGGSALNESTYLNVGAGASKAVSIVATLSTNGLAQFDNGTSKDIIIRTEGGNFVLRLIKVGESAL